VKKQTQNSFLKIVRDAGLRATKPRLLLLSLLQKAKYPVSIKDLRSQLKRAGIDQVTAYRTLTSFKKIGIVSQVDFQFGSAYYELHDTKNDHHHIVCTKCRKVEDFKGCEYEKLAVKALKQVNHFARITSHSFEFFGLCNVCVKS